MGQLTFHKYGKNFFIHLKEGINLFEIHLSLKSIIRFKKKPEETEIKVAHGRPLKPIFGKLKYPKQRKQFSIPFKMVTTIMLIKGT